MAELGAEPRMADFIVNMPTYDAIPLQASASSFLLRF